MAGATTRKEDDIPTAGIDVTRMSVRQLKAELAARDVDISHCRDRSELLVLLRKARTAGPWDSGSFARRKTDNTYFWVELVDGMTAVCHYGEGTTGIVNVNELEPISAHELPCPDRFAGSFEAARAEAFLKSKLLVVSIVSGRGKPVREEAMQYMALASQEVRVMLGENAVFWRGKPTELKDTQFRQLAPVDMLPSLAIAVPLAADAMTVILAIPGAISRSQTLDSILEGLEAMEVHRQVMLARQNDEDVQLRQAQDQEYAEGLARDQAAAANAAAAAAQQQEAVRPAPVQQSSEPARQVADPADEARRALAEEFLREGPSPTKADPVRLVLKLPTGERVERTFESQDPLARVRRWAQSSPLLPEAEGRQLQIPASFELATAFPRRKFVASELNCTLRELGLAPSAALLLIEEET